MGAKVRNIMYFCPFFKNAIKMKRTFIFLLTIMMITACHTEKRVSENEDQQSQNGGGASTEVVENNSPLSVASPQVIVYKMRKDYSQNVPVILSADKKTILSYPHPRDIYTNGKLAVPTQLKGGYWLDNRGISENVAFLSYTYEEYAVLGGAPSVSELYKKIIDKNPITEMWNCGRRHQFQDVVSDLNEAIANGELSKRFQKVK